MQHGLDAVEDRLVGVRHHELLAAAVPLGGVDAQEPREFGVDEQRSGETGARALGEDAVVAAHEVEESVDHRGEVEREQRALLVVPAVPVPVVAEQPPEDVTAIGEGIAHRRARAHEVGVLRLRDDVEQIDGRPREVGVGDAARDRDPGARPELRAPHLVQTAVAADGEEVVTSGDPDLAARRQLDFEDPIGRAFVPTRDRVVAHLEGVGIEADDEALLLLADDVADGNGPEHPALQHHDRLAGRKARVDEEAEAAERRLSLEPRHQVVRQRHAFEGGAEHELAGMEDERAAFGDLDQLGEVLLGLLRVDVRRRVVAEDAEQRVDVQVDRGRLDRVVAQRLDHDATGRQLLADGDVRQDHGGEPIGGLSRRPRGSGRIPCSTSRRPSRSGGTARARPRGSAAGGSGATPCPGR